MNVVGSFANSIMVTAKRESVAYLENNYHLDVPDVRIELNSLRMNVSWLA